ncbi:MAG: hypothetical protein CNC06_03835 [Pelagibacterales bacterium MED-G40]|nr:MAG: hypothetical protein CNC06_03835 [Pelagibacterales bacterium MED-G40]
MKKIFGLLITLLLLNGCAESVALLGSSIGGASSGKIAQSSLNTAVSYGVKKQTGKGPLEHVLAYAEKVNPEKKKEPCLSFIQKTNSEICAIVKKQLNLTKSKIINETRDESLKDLASSIQLNINTNSKIKHLD